MTQYDDNLLEPISFYKNTLKQRVHDAACTFFDSIVKKAAINVDENRDTVNKYDNASERLSDAKKRLNKINILKGFTIFFVIAFLLVGIGLIVYGSVEDELGLGLGVGIPSILVGIALIIVICLVINKKQKERRAIVERISKECEQLYGLACTQMSPLFQYYDYSTAYEIFDEAVDIINFDKFFDKAKLRYLIEKCDYVVDEDESHSTLYVKSGEILGNPFI